jgi:hypothetical protein
MKKLFPSSRTGLRCGPGGPRSRSAAGVLRDLALVAVLLHVVLGAWEISEPPSDPWLLFGLVGIVASPWMERDRVRRRRAALFSLGTLLAWLFLTGWLIDSPVRRWCRAVEFERFRREWDARADLAAKGIAQPPFDRTQGEIVRSGGRTQIFFFLNEDAWSGAERFLVRVSDGLPARRGSHARCSLQSYGEGWWRVEDGS